MNNRFLTFEKDKIKLKQIDKKNKKSHAIQTFTAVYYNLNMGGTYYTSCSMSLEEYIKKYPYFSYRKTVILIKYVIGLISILKQKGYGIPFFSLSDFTIVIMDDNLKPNEKDIDKWLIELDVLNEDTCVNDDNVYFFYTNSENIIAVKDDHFKYEDISKHNTSRKTLFINHEITKKQKKIHYSCGFSSLGLLVIYVLFKQTIEWDKLYKVNIEKAIQSLYPLPMYWFLKRCLTIDPSKRYLLYI